MTNIINNLSDGMLAIIIVLFFILFITAKVNHITLWEQVGKIADFFNADSKLKIQKEVNIPAWRQQRKTIM